MKVIGTILCMVLFSACAELNPRTEGQLQAALESQTEAFKACYESALRRDRNTKGKMGLELRIEKNTGKVSSASIEKSNIGDAKMKQCVAGAAEEMALPEPPGKTVEGHWDVAFEFE
jgi:hypothetical protein